MTDRLLTARELGLYLGVSTHTVLDWWQDGRLPGFKLNGRAVRFRSSEVEAWLEEQRRPHAGSRRTVAPHPRHGVPRFEAVKRT